MIGTAPDGVIGIKRSDGDKMDWVLNQIVVVRRCRRPEIVARIVALWCSQRVRDGRRKPSNSGGTIAEAHVER